MARLGKIRLDGGFGVDRSCNEGSAGLCHVSEVAVTQHRRQLAIKTEVPRTWDTITTDGK